MKSYERERPGFSADSFRGTPFHRRREADLARKKKEDEETARVYADFVTSFEQSDGSSSRSWVRGESINWDNSDEKQMDHANDLYDPPRQRQINLDQKPPTSVENPTDEEKPNKKRMLGSFLKMIKSEQQKRIKRKPRKPDEFKVANEPQKFINDGANRDRRALNTDSRELTTLHVRHVGNFVDENALYDEFCRFGPIRNVEIVQLPPCPYRQCQSGPYGIVEFAEARDAEAAMRLFFDADSLGHNVRIGWGNFPTDLCHHCDDKKNAGHNTGLGSGLSKDADSKRHSERMIAVVIPDDPEIRAIIHRLVERTIVNGPDFEKVIMEREKDNPKFRFLFDNNLDEHNYYRWKLYSVSQGDDVHTWRESPFQMYSGSCTWMPPRIRDRKDTGHDDGTDDGYFEYKDRMNGPEYIQQVLRKYEKILIKLDNSRSAIAGAMVYAINHSEYAEEITDLICKSLSFTSTPVFPLKLSRLFLVSDILYNSSTNIPNCWKYRMYFEKRLPDIFKHLGYVRKNLQKRLKQEQLRIAVSNLVAAWERWIIFPSSYTQNLIDLFIESVPVDTREDSSPQHHPDDLHESPSLAQKDMIGTHFCPVPEALDDEPEQSATEPEQSTTEPDRTNEPDRAIERSPRSIYSSKYPSSHSKFADLSDDELSGLSTPEESS